jgi:uncharacterized protein (TIGR03086 family)
VLLPDGRKERGARAAGGKRAERRAARGRDPYDDEGRTEEVPGRWEPGPRAPGAVPLGERTVGTRPYGGRMTDHETLALHAAALDLFTGHVHRVRPDQWSRPTPCEDWSVRDLVNHMTVEQLWVPPLLAGDTTEELGDPFAGDQLGDDPVAAWDDAAAQARAAFSEPVALSRTVHLSYGDSPAEAYCMEMAVDAVVHSWDLARGIGADDGLPAELAEFALQQVEPQASVLAASGLFADPVPVPSDADAQTRLLGLTGRRA